MEEENAIIVVLAIIIIFLLYYNYQKKKTINKLKNELKNLRMEINNLNGELKSQEHMLNIFRTNMYKNLESLSASNTKLIPYVSKIISDVETANFEILAKSLEWGASIERQKKVNSIREIKKNAKELIEKSKWSEYQLTYLLSLYPALQEVIETDYEDLQMSYEEATDSDPVRNYLSVDEWKNLSTTEKNQLALDRYVESRKKSKWQIGRDYELYIGYLYQHKGYKIDYFGSYMGIEDLGRDLIATKNNKTLVIQCKYWSQEKKIHEKHIMQLYGSLITYMIENNTDNVKGILVTNIELSDTAKKFAEMLKIQYVENKALGSFPRIKCNIGHDEFGHTTRIYHLPMDFQYDKTKIDKNGEMMVTTVAEAEAAGFRRAYKWHGVAN